MALATTILAYFLGWAALTITFPLALLIAVARDALAGRRTITARLLVFLWVYLSCECLSLVCMGWAWLVIPHKSNLYQEIHYALQRRWVTTLFHTLRIVLQLRYRVEGNEHLGQAPFLIFVRHTSIADTLLPGYFVTNPTRLRMRYVLKHELNRDPCIHIVGQRTPNYFVRRLGSTEKALAGMRELARNLGPRDGALIYPEGTRYSARKHQTALKRLAKQSPELYAIAKDFNHVMPPRLAGPIAMLEEAAGKADVVFMAHTGFDRMATIQDLLDHDPIGVEIRIRFWRVPHAEIPSNRFARERWLFQQWGKVEAFAGESMTAS